MGKKTRKAEEVRSHALLMKEVKDLRRQTVQLEKVAKKKTTAKEELVNKVQATPALLESAKTTLSEAKAEEEKLKVALEECEAEVKASADVADAAAASAKEAADQVKGDLEKIKEEEEAAVKAAKEEFDKVWQ